MLFLKLSPLWRATLISHLKLARCASLLTRHPVGMFNIDEPSYPTLDKIKLYARIFHLHDGTFFSSRFKRRFQRWSFIELKLADNADCFMESLVYVDSNFGWAFNVGNLQLTGNILSVHIGNLKMNEEKIVVFLVANTSLWIVLYFW